jgi:hypothetical protein
VDETTYAAAREATVAAHEYLMARGMVTAPILNAFRGGRMLGYIQLRPVKVGKDAAEAVEELGLFAAGGEADEVVLAWESQDLAAATGQEPDYDGPCLSLVHAARGRGHRLHRLPYREQYTGTRSPETGLHASAPDWLVAPSPEDDAALPEPVDAAVAMAWASWDPHPNPGLDVVGRVLAGREFMVRVAAYRSDGTMKLADVGES